MEKLKDAPASTSRDKPDQSISATYNGNSNERYYEKLKKRTAFINEVGTKIDALNVSKEEKDAISDAINIVFTWDKADNRQLRAKINSLLNDLDICSDEADQRNEQMQRTIAEQQETITELIHEIDEHKETIFNLERLIADTTLIFNEEIKALENEIAELKKRNSNLQRSTSSSSFPIDIIIV